MSDGCKLSVLAEKVDQLIERYLLICGSHPAKSFLDYEHHSEYDGNDYQLSCSKRGFYLAKDGEEKVQLKSMSLAIRVEVLSTLPDFYQQLESVAKEVSGELLEACERAEEFLIDIEQQNAEKE